MASAAVADCEAGQEAAGLRREVPAAAGTGRWLAWGDEFPTPHLAGVGNVCMPSKTFLNISPGREKQFCFLILVRDEKYFPVMCQMTTSLSVPILPKHDEDN